MSLRSMTGFGTASAPVEGGRMIAEVRSVNARFLEARLALPREQAVAEAEVRELVQKQVERGRVDVLCRREGTGRRRARLVVDEDLARAHVAAWRGLQKKLALPGEIDVSLLQRSASGIVREVEATPDPEGERKAMMRAIGAALRAHARDREREGANLKRELASRIARLSALRGKVVREAEGLRPVFAERLRKRVATLLEGAPIDEARVVHEVALAIDRSDVSEELARLGSHLDALRKLLGESGSLGKRFEFLLQETLREVNTIGSKANHLPITQAVLEAKAELEKLREQIQNVE